MVMNLINRIREHYARKRMTRRVQAVLRGMRNG